MRLTFVGKSGAGKSTIAGLVCRGLAERGERVLAIDADNVPGLAPVLGLDVGDEWFLADAAVRKVEGPGWDITMTAAEAVDRYAVDGLLGIRYLQMGKIGTSALTETQLAGFAAFGRMIADFDEPDGWLVLDTLGGILHAAAGWTAGDGPILVVVEPFVKSVITAARLVGMADEHTAGRLVGVGNKVATQGQRAWLAGELERIGLPLWAEVPADPAVAEAERNNTPLVDLPAGSPAMTAVTDIVDRLRAGRWSVGTSSSKEGT